MAFPRQHKIFNATKLRDLLQTTSAEFSDHCSHGNGWWRSGSLRSLVQGRGQRTTIPPPSSASQPFDSLLAPRILVPGPTSPVRVRKSPLPLKHDTANFSTITVCFLGHDPNFHPVSSLSPTPGDSPSNSGHSSPATATRMPLDSDPRPSCACARQSRASAHFPGAPSVDTPLQLQPITVLGV